MDIGALINQLRGASGALPTFGGIAPGAAPAAPAVPADGAMQPTIGPGVAPPVAQAPIRAGLPSGGLLAMMQGKANPQGIMGLLQRLSAGGPQAGAPMNGAPPAAGMLGGGPLGGQSNMNLPMNIKPMDMF